MLDAVVIFTELFRALWHGPCGSAEIATNFYSREKIAISTLPSDKHDGQQKWIATDDTTMTKGARSDLSYYVTRICIANSIATTQLLCTAKVPIFTVGSSTFLLTDGAKNRHHSIRSEK